MANGETRTEDEVERVLPITTAIQEHYRNEREFALQQVKQQSDIALQQSKQEFDIRLTYLDRIRR